MLSILVPGTAVAFVNRYVALLLYVWFGLFRPQDWMWLDISAFQPSLILGIVLVVPALLLGTYPNLSHPLSIAGVGFLMTTLVAQANAAVPAIGWYWVDFLVRLLVVSLLAVTIVSTERRFLGFLAVIACSFGFHSAKAGLASLLGGGLRFQEGLAGAFSDNNGYALGMVMTAPLLVAVGQNVTARWLRLGLYAAAGFTGLAVISTFSRGGFLGLMAVAVTFALLQRRKLRGVAAIAVLAIPFWFFVRSQEGYTERLSTIQTYNEVQETSAISRLHFWQVAVDMALDNPFGIGLFNYEAAYDEYDFLNGAYGRRRAVHSSHFQVLAETGWLGACCYVFLFACAFRTALRVRRRGLQLPIESASRRLFVTGANALMASMGGFLVGGAFIALALNDLTWLTFAMVASLDRISAACEPVRALSKARGPVRVAGALSYSS